ncbi:MAG: TolC family protein, partial [Trueperaceae bacterium]|nr:TolC family protein [Trueperaceae bacterium]
MSAAPQRPRRTLGLRAAAPFAVLFAVLAASAPVLAQTEAPLTWGAALARLEGAPDVADARAAVRGAERALAAARAPWSGSVDASVSRDAPFDDARDATLRGSVGASGTWTGFGAGATGDAVARAEADLNAARADAAAARRTATVDLAASFADLLRAQHVVRLRSADRDAADARLAAWRERAEAGAASDAQVRAADAAAQRAAQDLRAAERDVDAARDTLAQFLGTPVTRVAGPLPSVPAPAALEAPLAAALDGTAEPPTDRPDLVRARNAVDEARRTLDAARRDAAPRATASLGLTGGAGDDAALALDLSIDSRQRTPSVGGTATFGSDAGAGGGSFSATLGASVPLDPAAGPTEARLEASLDRARDALERARDAAAAEIAARVRAVRASADALAFAKADRDRAAARPLRSTRTTPAAPWRAPSTPSRPQTTRTVKRCWPSPPPSPSTRRRSWNDDVRASLPARPPRPPRSPARRAGGDGAGRRPARPRDRGSPRRPPRRGGPRR